MKSLPLKITALTMALLASGSVFADVHKSIYVSAEVAAALDLVNGDGTPLPGSGAPFRMIHTPGVGVQPITIPVKIFTNDGTKGVSIRLEGTPALNTAGAASGSGVPLTVRFKDADLTGTPERLTPDALAFSPNVAGHVWPVGSKAWDLVISQTTPAALPKGSYTGEIRIVLAQAT